MLIEERSLMSEPIGYAWVGMKIPCPEAKSAQPRDDNDHILALAALRMLDVSLASRTTVWQPALFSLLSHATGRRAFTFPQILDLDQSVTSATVVHRPLALRHHLAVLWVFT